MNNYRNSRSNRTTFRGQNSKGAPMFDAVCDKCGKDCKVPFRPSGNKPVYCSDCFEQKEGRTRKSPNYRRNQNFSPKRESYDSSPTGPNYLPELSKINQKLDELIDVIKKDIEARSEIKPKRITKAKAKTTKKSSPAKKKSTTKKEAKKKTKK